MNRRYYRGAEVAIKKSQASWSLWWAERAELLAQSAEAFARFGVLFVARALIERDGVRGVVAIFVVRAGVEAGARSGIRPEIADQTEKRERALLIRFDADAVAIEAAEVGTSQVGAAAAGAAGATALVGGASG